jgi:hypothetical protein
MRFIAPGRVARVLLMIRLSKRVLVPMSVNVMLLPFRPMSNNERQRRFRERNPGYYGRLHARGRAGAKAGAAQLLAAAKAMAEKHEPLALPAPVVTIEIPGMTMIPALSPLSALGRINGDGE